MFDDVPQAPRLTCSRPDPIAIVGMSGRFPDADDVDAFWRNLRDGRDSVGEPPRDRGWLIEDVFDPKPQVRGKTYSRHGGFLRNIDKFDPLFFEIAPNSAELMDPSARIFLEEAWRAIEDSGHSTSSLNGARCALYFCAKGDYSALVQTLEPTYLASTDTYVPARLAYHLNLVGPAMSLDTACSSTLAAVAHACDALSLGNCDLAVVGGGGLNATPNALVTSSQLTLFSPTGRCRTFDADADGTVLGEVVGALVLKPLARAEADHDHIYGLVRAWGTNQDGRTNGLTAPSAKSQTRLQTEIYRRFGVDPCDITMVEAHGTGTRLGDPIEVQALTDSFRAFTDQRNYCALGSLKTNIGHPFFGAGVASVIKVLQSLRNQAIPATLNFEKINPAIRIEESPFFINTTLKTWPRQESRPRLAAINAFGATGINAHVVIEDYAQPASLEQAEGEVLITLSAKSSERLRQKAADLLTHLSSDEARQGFAMADVAYTLQVGRDAMSERLAFVAARWDDACARLAAFVDGAAPVGVMTGGLAAGAMARMETSERLKPEVAAALDGGALADLARLWVQGGVIDWGRLHGTGSARRRVRLPTYPFAGERYWLEREAPTEACASRTSVPRLHPLVHSNVSTLQEQLFRTEFSGEEAFLRDHKINGACVLPGVAYLEMARDAVARSLAPEEQNRLIVLEKVVWLQPFVFGPDERTVRIALDDDVADLDGDARRIRFEIFAETAEGGDGTLHCQGEAVIRPQGAPPLQDVPRLLARCDAGTVTGPDLYPQLQAAGFGLGPAHQGISTLYVGRGEALARLKLPAEAGDGFVMHPSLLDSALQAAAGLTVDASGRRSRPTLMLPFAVEQVTIVAPCPEDAWAWVRPSSGRAPGDRTTCVDIDLCDDLGRVCVRLTGLTSRMSGGVGDAVVSGAARTILLQPVWRPAPVERRPSPAATIRSVLVCYAGPRSISAELLERSADVGEVTAIRVSAHDVAEAYEIAARAVMSAARGVLSRAAARSGERALLQLVIEPSAKDLGLEGLAALLRSAAREGGDLAGQTVMFGSDISASAISDVLDDEAGVCRSSTSRYEGGRRLELCEEELRADPSEATGSPWRSDGVYLIAGGAGGLGLILTAEIVDSAPGATVVLASRHPPTAEAQRVLGSMRAAGRRVEHRRADLVDAASVDALVSAILGEHGRLTGVVHCAGALSDGYIVNKTDADLTRVLAPKVRGLVNLDAATRALPLELFIGFSSLAAVFGNAGQSDYAAANGFMDAFLAARASRVQMQGGGSCRAVSINWPLWRDGGMHVDAAYEALMARTSGMQPLPREAGLAAFRTILATGLARVMVVHGTPGGFSAGRSPAPPSEGAAPPPVPTAGTLEADPLIRDVIRLLQQLVGSLIRVEPTRIDPDADLSEFGLDSISLTQLSNTLHDDYHVSLSPTIFFEYSTIRAFASHLVEVFEDELRPQLATHGDPPLERSSPEDPSADSVAAPLCIGASPPARRRSFADRRRRGDARVEEVPPVATPPRDESIAIIGMSGQFPQAKDLNAFWSNLVEGRDCITEIPSDRWDWKAIDGDPLETSGRTNIRWGGFIDGVGDWDPAFFATSPRDAELIDPSKRLLMTHVWKAVEDAGYSPSSLAGSNTALFIGSADSGYSALYAQAGVRADGSGTPVSMGPNRMSYFLDLHGPSEPIETACSSSLVAIHRAVGALRQRDSDLVVAGGVQVIPTAAKHISFSQGGVLSKTGRCKSFSSQADGYVRAEGVGMLVLKRLADAERDGDAVYAVILSSTENHGGRANSLTSPNPRAQAQLLVDAYRKAGVDPRTIGYIETHGTGTLLGDPIEINGLKAAFRRLYEDTGGDTSPTAAHQPGGCALGSVKTNIGHTELAAGVAGVIKVLLQMRHRTLVKTLHCDELNPHIDLSNSPFEVLRESRPWERAVDARGDPTPRRAGVSSFGVGGVNAHLVLEEYQ